MESLLAAEEMGMLSTALQTYLNLGSKFGMVVSFESQMRLLPSAEKCR